MSAMTGICDFFAIAGSASASSWDGTATRTIWQPAAVSCAICWSVAFTSAVRVVVIDCTDTGASPPTGTVPTMIWRDFPRMARGVVGTAGMPSAMAVKVSPFRGWSSAHPPRYGTFGTAPYPPARFSPGLHRRHSGAGHSVAMGDPANLAGPLRTGRGPGLPRLTDQL